MKFDGAAPTRVRRPLRMENSSTARDQPSPTARAAYQSRSAWLSNRSSRTSR